MELRCNKKDDRMEFVIQLVEKAIGIFVKAIDESTEEHHEISFRAFELSIELEEEAKTVFDIIMTIIAVELNKQACSLISKFTFYHNMEKSDSGYALFLHCRKVAPPSKEEIEALAQEPEAKTEALSPPSESAQVCRDA